MSNPSGFLPHAIQLPEARTQWGWLFPEVKYDDFERTLQIGALENLLTTSNYEPRRLRVEIDGRASFRVLDESELTHYWAARSAEGIDPKTSIYRIQKSDYLDEAKATAFAHDRGELRHLLFAGGDACVEVIIDNWTQIRILPSGGQDQ